MNRFVLTVTSGADLGKYYEAEGGICLIGRSEKADFRLQDETVSWEHARITVSGRGYVLENLSALGTVINNSKVSAQNRVRHNDRLMLSHRCVLKFELSDTGTKKVRNVAWLVGFLGVALAVAGGAALRAIAKSDRTPTYTHANYQHAFEQLSENLATWSHEGLVPSGFAEQFASAWRVENLGDSRRSAAMYNGLWSHLLTSASAAGGINSGTIGELDTGGYDQLKAYLDRGRSAARELERDDRLRALVQFVGDRARAMSRKAENNQ